MAKKTTLETISTDIAAVVAAVSPHVVRVESRRRLPATGIVLGDGLIATAQHVLRKKTVMLGLEDGSSAEATVVGVDPTTDLAILKTDAALAKFPMAQDVGAVGNFVLALGRPGKTVRATLGIVSAVGDAWRTSMGGNIDRYLETDITMYPGFSGGPLVNAAGELVGMNSSALARGATLTIPTATVLRISAELVEHGQIKRAYLGISTKTVRLPRDIREMLEQKTGLVLINVEENSPAAKAGLVLGDTIVAVAGQPVRHHDDLLGELSAEIIGEKTPVSIIRGGELQSLNVVLAEKS